MARKKQGIPPFLAPKDNSGRFVMFPPDIFKDESFNSLSHQAGKLYIVMAMNTSNPSEQRVCRAVIDSYIRLGVIEDMSEDTKVMRTGGMFNGVYHHAEWFTFTQLDAEENGYPTRSRVDAYKKELIEKGFIKIVCKGKGRKSHNGYTKNATLYAFSNEWKKLN